MGIDPLADKYFSLSPYIYCANNPLKFVDPDGRGTAAALYGAAAAELGMLALSLAAVESMANASETEVSTDFADNASLNLSVMFEVAKVAVQMILTGTVPAESESTDVTTNIEASRTKQHERTKRQPKPPRSQAERKKQTKGEKQRPPDSQPTRSETGKPPKVEVPTQLKPEKPAGKPFPWPPPPYIPGAADDKNKKDE